jgi:hypothetical protein
VNHTVLAVVAEVPTALLSPVAHEAAPPQQSDAVPLAEATPEVTPATISSAPTTASTDLRTRLTELRVRTEPPEDVLVNRSLSTPNPGPASDQRS